MILKSLHETKPQNKQKTSVLLVVFISRRVGITKTPGYWSLSLQKFNQVRKIMEQYVLPFITDYLVFSSYLFSSKEISYRKHGFVLFPWIL